MKWTRHLIVLWALTGGYALADSQADRQAIEHLMKHTWERPEAALDVGPVTLEGDYAIAGWTQAERGGRALLTRVQDHWKVVLCAGDGLLDEATLKDAVLAQREASDLLRAVRTAESVIAPERVRQFSRFKGTVRVDAHAGHGDPQH